MLHACLQLFKISIIDYIKFIYLKNIYNILNDYKQIFKTQI